MSKVSSHNHLFVQKKINRQLTKIEKEFDFLIIKSTFVTHTIQVKLWGTEVKGKLLFDSGRNEFA